MNFPHALPQIQSSGQRIEYFAKLQLQCGVSTPLKIPLHGNTRWGSAYGMLDRAYRLRQVREAPNVSYNCSLTLS